MARAFVPHTITSDSALGGSVIDHSIRFNRGDNPHFSRTPSSAGNRKVLQVKELRLPRSFGLEDYLENGNLEIYQKLYFLLLTLK